MPIINYPTYYTNEYNPWKWSYPITTSIGTACSSVTENIKTKEIEDMILKTRFCPSPTGFLHLGSTYIMLKAYAYAKKTGGRIQLRFEDSDQQRSTHESVLDIISGIEWLGLKFDKSPNFETLKKSANRYSKEFFQSKRGEIYNKAIDDLIKENKAYINEEGVTVFRMAQDDYSFCDGVMGPIMLPRSEIKDFPIRRADGSALFHLCVVIDDIENHTNCIIRAVDHLSNTSKHVALYKAFNHKLPTWNHLPLILDEKGEKLSKRRTDQPVLIKDFRANGYLPETIIQMCASLAWSNPNKLEDFTLEDFCKTFDLKNCLSVNPRYDPRTMLNLNFSKLKKLTKEHFIEKLRGYGEEYYPNIVAFFDKESEKYTFDQFAGLFYQRSKTLKDPFINCSFLLTDENEIEDSIINDIKENPAIKYVEQAMDLISSFDFAKNNIVELIKDFAAQKSLKTTDAVQFFRMCLTMSKVSPPIDLTIMTLGKENCIFRFRQAIEYINTTVENFV